MRETVSARHGHSQVSNVGSDCLGLLPYQHDVDEGFVQRGSEVSKAVDTFPVSKCLIGEAKGSLKKLTQTVRGK